MMQLLVECIKEETALANLTLETMAKLRQQKSLLLMNFIPLPKGGPKFLEETFSNHLSILIFYHCNISTQVTTLHADCRKIENPRR